MMCMFLKFRPWIFSLSVVLVCGCHMESEHDQDGEPGYLEDEMMCPRSGDNFLEQRQVSLWYCLHSYNLLAASYQ